MKTTKIKIKNLFGVSELELGGESVELSGKNGTGKSSVLDSIRYALTNGSDRDYIIKQGEKEGEIIIEAGASLRIDRKKRTEQADYKSVKADGREVSGAESFLRTIFSPMQLDPVAFVQMTKAEQNRLILDMIEFPWDLNWIREKFGEIPEGIDYSQNILQVLNDIQAENGAYFQRRQEINRDARNKKSFVEEIARDIPANYEVLTWEQYDLGAKYREIEQITAENSRIERAKTFLAAADGAIRAIDADYEIGITAEEKAIASERTSITENIARMEEQIKAERERLGTLDGKLSDKRAKLEAERGEKKAKLGGDLQIAKEYAAKPIVDTTAKQAEVATAEAMKKHLREYARMQTMQSELEKLNAQSEALTEKIELARNLPGEILQTATIPIEGLTVVDGRPLIHGMPVSNLSDGEKLTLCVDVALAKPNSLQIILIDGAERLSDENRAALYARCKEKGLQFIATRTTNDNEMEVHYL
ncbi:MAG TPA: AAA family ATPase [Candidatus Limiplasma sp.]|nr:AAA family ATPase [Candidatus Limiplasma sp.]